MTKPLACLMWFVVALLVQRLFAQTAPASAEWSRIEAEGLALRIPADWERLEPKESVLTIAAAKKMAERFRDNIRVKRYPLQGARMLADVVAAQKHAAQDRYEVLGSGMLAGEGPPIAWLTIHEKELKPGQVDLAKVDYMLIEQDFLLVLHAVCETSQLDEQRQTFDAIARSIELQNLPGINPAAETERSEAYENGKVVGEYTLYAMVAAVAVWVLVRLIGFAVKKK